MNSVFILANGNQVRFGSPESPKQLTEIDGKPLLVRTIEQVSQKVDFIRILSKNEVIKAKFPDLVFDPGDTKTLQATMLASKNLWHGRVTFLFGDCYYTQNAIDQIFAYDRPYAHFCRPFGSKKTWKPWGESFAMTWVEELYPRVLGNLAPPVPGAPFADYMPGTSWNFYRKMTGADLWNARTEWQIVIDDMTDDFDFPSDPYNWLKAREEHKQRLMETL